MSRTVSIEEIKQGNPRLCLSALRYFGKCYQCPAYQTKDGKPCNSRIESQEGQQALTLRNKKEELKQQVKEIEQRLKEL